MGRLLGKLFKLAIILGVIVGVATVVRKLMGGLGPQPGDADAPKEWPSLVPEPAPLSVAVNGNGAASPSGTGDLPGDSSIGTAEFAELTPADLGPIAETAPEGDAG